MGFTKVDPVQPALALEVLRMRPAPRPPEKSGRRNDRRFSMPPHLGRDVKNIRRCLNPPNPNYASFCAAIGSALATLLAASDLFTKGAPFWEIAALIGVAAAAATAAGLQLRADRRAGDNPHLREAQADADILVTWQEDARVQVDRDLQARLIDEQRRMRVEEDAPSLTDDSGDRSVGTPPPGEKLR